MKNKYIWPCYNTIWTGTIFAARFLYWDFHGVFTCSIFDYCKDEVQTVKLFAGVLSFTNAVDAIKFLQHGFPVNYINLEAFRWSTNYLVSASFYLYVLSVCYTNFRLKPKHLIHVIPFLAFNAFMMWGIYFSDRPSKIKFINSMNDMPLLQFFLFLFEALFQVYFIASFMAIRKAKKYI